MVPSPCQCTRQRVSPLDQMVSLPCQCTRQKEHGWPSHGSYAVLASEESARQILRHGIVATHGNERITAKRAATRRSKSTAKPLPCWEHGKEVATADEGTRKHTAHGKILVWDPPTPHGIVVVDHYHGAVSAAAASSYFCVPCGAVSHTANALPCKF